MKRRADQDQLRFYQKYFPLVEINNTFYREPMLTNFVDIERRSRPATKYVVKVYRDISHTKRWEAETGKALMRNHITAVSPLVETGRFYSFLIQLEDRTIRNQERLDYFLAVASEAVRMKLDVHIEFRHNSWHNLYPLQALKDSGIGICNTEIPPVKYAFPLKAYATTEKGYVRYSGRNIQNWVPKGKQKTSKARIEARNARYDYLYSEPEMEERGGGADRAESKGEQRCGGLQQSLPDPSRAERDSEHASTESGLSKNRWFGYRKKRDEPSPLRKACPERARESREGIKRDLQRGDEMTGKDRWLLVGLMVCAALVGGSFTSWLVLREEVRTKTYHAEELRLVDSENRTRARLVLGLHGEPGLAMMDADGKTRFTLGLGAEGAPSVNLLDRGGRVRAKFDLSTDGSPELVLSDTQGRVIWSALP